MSDRFELTETKTSWMGAVNTSENLHGIYAEMLVASASNIFQTCVCIKKFIRINLNVCLCNFFLQMLYILTFVCVIFHTHIFWNSFVLKCLRMSHSTVQFELYFNGQSNQQWTRWQAPEPKLWWLELLTNQFPIKHNVLRGSYWRRTKRIGYTDGNKDI